MRRRRIGDWVLDHLGGLLLGSLLGSMVTWAFFLVMFMLGLFEGDPITIADLVRREASGGR